MVDTRRIERDVLAGLRKFLRNETTRPCEFARQNETGPVPPYPYIAYTVTTLRGGARGTPARTDGGWTTMVEQVWSFTVHSDDDDESMALALAACDWLDVVGTAALSDAGVVARRVGDVAGRDNLLTVAYEYRKGFDVRFALMSTVPEGEEWIETCVKVT